MHNLRTIVVMDAQKHGPTRCRMTNYQLNGAPQPTELARAARLRYVSDEEPGYARKRNGHGFVYLNIRGKRLSSQRHLARIEKLAIPPAWQEVWICACANGHLQATGRDDRKRKQYIYHERWREASQRAKFWRLAQFGRLLPKLRSALFRALRGRTLSRPRVLAAMVALLDATSIRVGNEEYVKENGSYGLATLRDRHVTVGKKQLTICFRGKAGLRREVIVSDNRLAQLLVDCRNVPGPRLFQYVDESGRRHSATAADVNAFLHELTGQSFTAKDFRTWKASSLVAEHLYRQPPVESLGRRKRIIREAVKAAAAELGNTPTVCRKYYIHPWLIEAYEQNLFPHFFGRFKPRPGPAVRADEQILMRFLNKCDDEPGAIAWNLLASS